MLKYETLELQIEADLHFPEGGTTTYEVHKNLSSSPIFEMFTFLGRIIFFLFSATSMGIFKQTNTES